MKDRSATIIIILLAVVIFLIGFLIGGVTTKSANTIEQTATSDEMFVVIEDHAFLNYCIVYYRSVGTGGSLHPLYNADGSLKLYSGGIEDDSL